jgi:hypothetical protein
LGLLVPLTRLSGAAVPSGHINCRRAIHMVDSANSVSRCGVLPKDNYGKVLKTEHRNFFKT